MCRRLLQSAPSNRSRRTSRPLRPRISLPTRRSVASPRSRSSESARLALSLWLAIGDATPRGCRRRPHGRVGRGEVRPASHPGLMPARQAVLGFLSPEPRTAAGAVLRSTAEEYQSARRAARAAAPHCQRRPRKARRMIELHALRRLGTAEARAVFLAPEATPS